MGDLASKIKWRDIEEDSPIVLESTCRYIGEHSYMCMYIQYINNDYRRGHLWAEQLHLPDTQVLASNKGRLWPRSECTGTRGKDGALRVLSVASV